jgi:hypothetical protein
VTRVQAFDLGRRRELAQLIGSTHREPEPVSRVPLDIFRDERAHHPLEYPSTDPLIACLNPLTRAVVVLLCRSREQHRTVAYALPALTQDPYTVLRRAAKLIAPAPLPVAYPNHLAIHRVLPDPRLRLPLALRASGLFDSAETIADLLRVDRATLYRRLERGMLILRSLSGQK